MDRPVEGVDPHQRLRRNYLRQDGSDGWSVEGLTGGSHGGSDEEEPDRLVARAIDEGEDEGHEGDGRVSQDDDQPPVVAVSDHAGEG